MRLLELSLEGWDLWPPFRLPLDPSGGDVVVITGPNGSGKTALLDAIRQLLDAPLSPRRRLQGYLRRPDVPALLRAVLVEEEDERTIACALVPGGGGAPERRFVIVPGRADAVEMRRLLLETRDWHGPEPHRRILEEAGIGPVVFAALGLEQGRAGDLVDLDPRELLRRLLEVGGLRSALDRYGAARRSGTAESLAEERRRWAATLSSSLRSFANRAAELTSTIGARLEIDLPPLAEDDRSLDEAGVAARIGLDGREPLPLQLLGAGERTLVGLVLLLAASRSGFVLLDEPFAHLSVDRVELAGRMLRHAGMQVVFTSAIGLERAPFEPAGLIVGLRRRARGEAWAPPPLLAVPDSATS
jgi:energy-coupling factor transporter ATP-binding protein EcfA2